MRPSSLRDLSGVLVLLIKAIFKSRQPTAVADISAWLQYKHKKIISDAEAG